MSNELRERIAELLELLRPATPSEAADAILAIPGIAVVELDLITKWLDDQAKHCTETAEDLADEPEAQYEEMFFRGQAVGFRIAAERFAAAEYAERNTDE